MGNHTHSMTREEAKFISYFGVRYARALCGRRVYAGALSVGGETCTICRRMKAQGRERNLPLAVALNPATNKRMTVKEFANRPIRPIGKKS